MHWLFSKRQKTTTVNIIIYRQKNRSFVESVQFEMIVVAIETENSRHIVHLCYT